MTVKAFALSVAFSAAVGAPSAWSQTQEAEEQTCSSQLEECKAYCSSLSSASHFAKRCNKNCRQLQKECLATGSFNWVHKPAASDLIRR